MNDSLFSIAKINHQYCTSSISYNKNNQIIVIDRNMIKNIKDDYDIVKDLEYTISIDSIKKTKEKYPEYNIFYDNNYLFYTSVILLSTLHDIEQKIFDKITPLFKYLIEKK